MPLLIIFSRGRSSAAQCLMVLRSFIIIIYRNIEKTFAIYIFFVYPNKKTSLEKSREAVLIRAIPSYASLAVNLESLDFRLPALFLWMIPRLATLSMMEYIFGSRLSASDLSVNDLNFLTSLRMDLA